MQRSAVLLARCLGFVEVYDLIPRGEVFLPTLIKEVVERYNFQKFPQEFTQFDVSKGIEFLLGKYNDAVIQRLALFDTGILIDTRVNTKTSQTLIEEALEWAKSKFGVEYGPKTIKRFGYVSQVTFRSEVNLNMLNPALEILAQRVTSAVSQIHKEQVDYQTTQIYIQHDQLKRKNTLAGFTISPRTETPLSEHKYFSEAPLPTDLHWQLLEEFEANLLA